MNEAPPILPTIATPPAGAGCAVHVGAPATFVCARCGSFGCSACLFSETSAGSTCQQCAARGVGGIPWEQWRERGIVRTWWDTTKLVIGAPTRFFRTPPRSPSAGTPIGFGLLSYTVGQTAYALLFGGFFAAIMGAAALQAAGRSEPALFGAFGMAAIVLFVVLMAPVMALIGIFVSAACSHGTLALMSSAKGGFSRTLHAMCYANAPHIFVPIPCVGPLLVLVWVPWLEAVGLREAHGISTGRAVLAAFSWRVALALLFLVAYGLFIAAIFSAIGSHPGIAPPR